MKKLTESQVRGFIWSFGIVLVLLLILYGFFSRKHRDTLDAFSYIFPILAGVAAGAGLYFNKESGVRKTASSPTSSKKIDRWFYSLSVIMLFLGLFSYAVGHQCRGPSIIVIILGLLFVTYGTLWSNVAKDRGRNGWIGVVFLILLGAAIFALAVAIAYFWFDFFEQAKHFYQCKVNDPWFK